MAINSLKSQSKKVGAVARTLLIISAVVAASCKQPTGDETQPDTTAPTVSVSSTAPDPTSTSPIDVTIVFSEAVIGFDPGDLTLVNALSSDFATADNKTFTVNLIPSADNLTVTLDIAAGACTDEAGNPNTALVPTFSRTYSP